MHLPESLTFVSYRDAFTCRRPATPMTLGILFSALAPQGSWLYAFTSRLWAIFNYLDIALFSTILFQYCSVGCQSKYFRLC